MVAGIILAGFGLSASFLIFLAESIINPSNENRAGDYYPESVYKNVPTYIIIICSIYTFNAIVGILCINPYKPEITEETIPILEKSDSDTKIQHSPIVVVEENPHETIKNGVLSKKYMATCAISLCSSSKFQYLFSKISLSFCFPEYRKIPWRPKS
jgi:hypothetical protein